ncbi:MAG: hypothetical protein OXF11_06355 [Deltaproteobacteria bacterium]|nr:hypothetical protein [Deltaproteobacteria bacterium]
MKESAKLAARVKLTLTKRTVDALEPQDKLWIAWDDRLSGFGVRGACPYCCHSDHSLNDSGGSSR